LINFIYNTYIMGFRQLARKSNRQARTIGRKSAVIARIIGQKAPSVIMNTGSALATIGKVGEAASGVIAMTGNAEIALPLLAASEALKYTGKGVSGVGRAAYDINNGDYMQAINTIEKTVIDSKKDKRKYDKKFV
jgi:hypothetical protein